MAAAWHGLAIDLGASSGRAMLGAFDGACLALSEVHRFPNQPLLIDGHPHWDAPRLQGEIKQALGRCTQRGIQLDSVAVDTWGVDFGLLDSGGELLALPRHYRDPRNGPAMQEVCQRLTRERIYERTGLQFLPFNTLFQLHFLAGQPERPLARAERLLFMPDLFTYWLSGAAATEHTIASTSQMRDPRSGAWAPDLLRELGLSAELLPKIEATGTLAGPLRAALAAETGQKRLSVLRTAGHDTAAAVAAVPARGAHWAYISSGTWSLVGCERTAPVISPEACAANVTNEAGVAGTTRLLRNVTGLWLEQECRRRWSEAGDDLSAAELIEQADRAAPGRSIVDPDAPEFAPAGDMPARIQGCCRSSGQPVPASPAEVLRCVYESLALKYDEVLTTLERLTGCCTDVIHVVGGGSQNALLNQLTADCTGRRVCAGPVEATASGNLLVQLLARGAVSSLADMRAIVARSAAPRWYEPRPSEIWVEMRDRRARHARMEI